MKKTITFWLGLLIFSSISAQEYEPTAIEGAHWVIFYITDDSIQHHAIVIEGDSVVNGVAYKKIYWQAIHSNAISFQDFVPPYLTSKKILIGQIRDNVSEEKVYAITFETPHLITCNVGVEEEIHDYSLSPGEFLTGCLYQTESSIDSVKMEFEWGKNREVQYIVTGHRFIEGIGGEEGPFSSNFTFIPEVFFKLVEYCIGTDDMCNLISTAYEAPAFKIYVYPNPATDLLKIEFPEDHHGTSIVSMRDSRGYLISEIEHDCNGAQVMNLPVDKLAKGIYFLTLKTGYSFSTYKVAIY